MTRSGDLVGFNADLKNFTFGTAMCSINKRDLVVLYARTLKCEANDEGSNWLSAAEAHRYHAYRSRKAAKQFLQGRTLIRKALACHLSAAPCDIDLCASEHIKPTARCQNPSKKIPQFNLSHSGDWITLAIHLFLPVGIDIECEAPPEIDTLSNSPELFTLNERGHLATITDRSQKAEMFLKLWRSKEAIMKATGKGFALTPNSIELLRPEGVQKTTICAEGSAWELRHHKLCSGLTCAVALAEPLK